MRLQQYLTEAIVVLDVQEFRAAIMSLKDDLLKLSWTDVLAKMSNKARAERFTKILQASPYFKKFNTKFTVKEEASADISGYSSAVYTKSKGTFTQSIGVEIPLGLIDAMYTNPELYEAFTKFLEQAFYHEYIHTVQHRKMFDRMKTVKGNKENKRPDSDKEYYGNKHEMMAYANTVVSGMVMHYNATKQQIMDFLRHPTYGESPVVDVYFDTFPDDPAILKKFIKYVYQYAELL